MRISTKEVDGIPVVSLSGHFYGGPDAEKLRGIFQEYVDDGKPNIVVDLKHLTRIISIGIGVLIGGWKHCQEAGGNLVIANPGSINLWAHGTVHLMFDTFDSVKDAIASFKTTVS